MTGHRKWSDLVAERRAKMTPEQRAHSDGYQIGFKDAFYQWEYEVAWGSLRGLLKLRRSLRKRIEKHDD